MRLFQLVFTVLVAASLAACAPMVVSEPAQLVAVPAQQQSTISASRDIEVALVWQYKSVIRAGTQWRLVGRVREGDVYQPVGTVFMVEGRDVHEAYLVVRDRKIVGFYLVGEARFAAMSPQIPFN